MQQMIGAWKIGTLLTEPTMKLSVRILKKYWTISKNYLWAFVIKESLESVFDRFTEGYFDSIPEKKNRADFKCVVFFEYAYTFVPYENIEPVLTPGWFLKLYYSNKLDSKKNLNFRKDLWQLPCKICRENFSLKTLEFFLISSRFFDKLITRTTAKVLFNVWKFEIL